MDLENPLNDHPGHPGESCESFEQRNRTLHGEFHKLPSIADPPGYTPLPEPSYRRGYTFEDAQGNQLLIQEYNEAGDVLVRLTSETSEMLLTQNQWEEVQRLYLRRKGAK